MFDKPQATHVLGLELDAISLKGVALSLVRGKPKLESALDFPIDNPTLATENVKPLYTPEQKKKLEQLLQKNLVVTTLTAQEVLVRPLELKIIKEKDIDAVLAFQAEPILPYPTDNALLDKIVLSKDSAGSKITLLAVRKDHLTNHLQEWHNLEIEPEVISAAPLALALFAKNFADTTEPCYALHLGWTQSFCTIVEQGKLVAAQAVPHGIKELVEVLAKEQEVDLSTARLNLDDTKFLAIQENPAFQNTFMAFRLSITRTIYALAKQLKNKEINQILITGPGAIIPQLPESISSALNKVLLPIQDNPTFGMDVKDLQKFALPIGAALSALPNCKDQVNFRQNEFAFPAPWKRLKKPIAIYMGLCTALAIALVFFGNSYIHYQESHIKRQYIDLLSLINRPYTEFEKEFTRKNPSARELAPGEVVIASTLTPDEIKERLQYLDKEIQAIPQIYPLLPNAPLVSDVLAWISTHPNFVGTTKDKDAKASLQIETFNYTLVKRPEPTKKQEKYQVKIELEFSSPTPKMAREFHDVLIAPNDIVDPKAEIKWSSNRDRYRTSFYLKDKTVYTGP